MPHEDYDSQEAIYRISMDDSLKDILLEIVGVFDNNYLFVYENWEKGVVCKGPEMSRHWVNVSFRWYADEKPDMDGAARLGKLDIIATGQEGVIQEKPEPDNIEEMEWSVDDEPVLVDVPVFYVHMEIPAEFVANIDEPMSDGLLGEPEEEEIGDPEEPEQQETETELETEAPEDGTETA